MALHQVVLLGTKKSFKYIHLGVKMSEFHLPPNDFFKAVVTLGQSSGQLKRIR